MTVGRRIRELRRAKGLTQRDLASLVRLDHTYVSKIENDRLPYTPAATTLEALAKALDADELELLALANKLPSGMRAAAGTPEARAFFRRTAGLVKSPQQWQALLQMIEEELGAEREESDQ